MVQINDNSVIERVERPKPPEVTDHVERKPAAPPKYEGADLSPLDLQMAESSEEALPDICFECARPTKKHTIAQAFKCRRKMEDRLAAREFEGEGEPEPEGRHHTTARDVARVENYHVETHNDVITPTEVITPPPSSLTMPAPAPLPLTANGEVDYEKLALSLKTVIEKERDEVVKRGGPLEKQNLDLKERLHRQLEETNVWRTRHHTAVQERNSYKEQLDAQIKINRKLRNDQREKKMKDHVRLVEIEDILAVVDKTPGWTREIGGTGHHQIYKNGVWVSDAAGSGGSTRVNMATRTKLRSAGLKV